MKRHGFWDLGQLLTAGIVLVGVCVEIIHKAEVGFILITFGSLLAFLTEKFKPK